MHRREPLLHAHLCGPGDGREGLPARGRVPDDRRVLLDRYRIRIDCVPGIGYRHLTDTETVNAGGAGVARVSRTARRERQRMINGVKAPQQLPAQEQSQFFARSAQLALVEHASSARATKTLSGRVSNGTLALSESLEALKKL